MRRGLLLLAVCAMFAATVQASPITCTKTGPVSIAATEDTTSDSTYNIVTITVTNIVGSTDLVLLEGAWTVTGGAAPAFYVPGKATNWQGPTTYNNPGTSSFVNLAAAMGSLSDGTVAYRTTVSAAANQYNPFANVWYQTSNGGVTADPNIDNGNILAVLYVTKDWKTITFGASGANYSRVGLLNASEPNAATFTLTTAPEPSTLALLGAGLVGLAAYAWRKRK